MHRDPANGSSAEGSTSRRHGRSTAVWLCLLVFFGGGMNGATCVEMPPPPSGRILNTAALGGPQILPQDHVIGDENAPVTLVEYADMQCTPCGRFARNELPTLMTEFVETGKVRFVYRHFPTQPRGEPAARAAECAADQGMFFEYLDLVFAEQMDSDFSDGALGDFADRIGLDRATFDACLGGNAKALRVQQDVTSGQALGVTTTPTFFINDRQMNGFQTANDLGDAIRRKINETVGG